MNIFFSVLANTLEGRYGCPMTLFRLTCYLGVWGSVRESEVAAPVSKLAKIDIMSLIDFAGAVFLPWDFVEPSQVFSFVNDV